MGGDLTGARARLHQLRERMLEQSRVARKLAEELQERRILLSELLAEVAKQATRLENTIGDLHKGSRRKPVR